MRQHYLVRCLTLKAVIIGADICFKISEQASSGAKWRVALRAFRNDTIVLHIKAVIAFSSPIHQLHNKGLVEGGMAQMCQLLSLSFLRGQNLENGHSCFSIWASCHKVLPHATIRVDGWYEKEHFSIPFESNVG